MLYLLLIFYIANFVNYTESIATVNDTNAKYQFDMPPVYDRHMGGVFVKKAFRVSNEEIRLLFLKDTFRKVRLWHKLSGKWERAMYDHIIPGIVDQCYFRGYMANIRIPPALHESPIDTIRLSISEKGRNASDLTAVDILVIDRRPTPDYEHTLGVMLQPAFFVSDWTAFVQYFESWIAFGVTRFFVFLHTYTKDVETVINFYQSKLGENLTVISWGDVPTLNHYDYFKDPNTRAFLAESVTAINYCIYLARHRVKYLAIFDLDDLPNPERRFEDILDDYDQRGNFSYFLFNWNVTYHQPPARVSTISELSFSHLTSLYTPPPEDIIGKYNGQVNRKYFCRPERVRHATVHRIPLPQRNEDGKFYGMAEIDAADGNVLHLKQFNFAVPLPQQPTADNLSGLVGKMVENLKERVKEDKIRDIDFGDWYNLSPGGLGTLFFNFFPKGVDSSNLAFAMCRSVKTLTLKIPQPELFIRPKNDWTNLYYPRETETLFTDEALERILEAKITEE